MKRSQGYAQQSYKQERILKQQFMQQSGFVSGCICGGASGCISECVISGCISGCLSGCISECVVCGCICGCVIGCASGCISECIVSGCISGSVASCISPCISGSIPGSGSTCVVDELLPTGCSSISSTGRGLPKTKRFQCLVRTQQKNMRVDATQSVKTFQQTGTQAQTMPIQQCTVVHNMALLTIAGS